MKSLLISLLSLLLGACASVPNGNPQDPYEALNRRTFAFNEGFDRYLFKPVAQGYDAVLPKPVKVGLNNFFSNLDDIGVTLNDLLQLKFRQAASDGSRVLFNSTFGVLGLINVTERLEKHHEDFGQTLGYWGVSSGAYLMLPFFGPSDLRDSVGLAGDSFSGVYPRIANVGARNSLYATDKVHLRANLFEFESTLDSAADRYAFLRDFYLARRQNLIYDGNPPHEKFTDEEDEPVVQNAETH